MKYRLAPLFAPLLCAIGIATAQNVGLPDADNIEGNNELLIRGDTQEFDPTRNMVVVKGNARVEMNGQVLEADQISLDRETMKAFAAGNVTITQPDGRSWKFTEFEYDFTKGSEQMPGAAPGDPDWRGDSIVRTSRNQLFVPPFTIYSEKSQLVSKNLMYLQDVMVTTCPLDSFSAGEPEFYVLAESADIYDGEIIVLTKARFYFNGVPIWRQGKYALDTKREATNYDVLPGFSSRDGAFLLNAYTWYPSENWHTTSHLDFRSNRGIGVGQDLAWYDRITKDEKEAAIAAVPFGELDRRYEEPLEDYRGEVTGYFTSDNEPYRSSEQEERERARGIDIDKERYRLRLSHNQALSENDLLYVEGNVWSDEEITKDFFNREYRLMPTPENRVNLVHFTEDYNLGLEVNQQLNTDDYSNINRVPEVTLAAFQKPVWDTGLYYDTFNSASRLEATFNEEARAAGSQDFESERMHTSHTLSYPMKYFGFLNFIPRATYAGTYYGDTFGTRSQSSVETMTDTNGVVTAVTNTTDQVVSLGNDFRNYLQFDAELSFKAFRVLHEDQRSLKSKGLRHVAEPHVNYVYAPEPNVRPTSLFPFDFIDTLDTRHDVTFGMRNKLQTKRMLPGLRNSDGSPVVFVQDMVDVDVFATYLLDPEDPDAEQLSSIFVDSEFRAGDWGVLDSRVEYDHQEGEIKRTETSAQIVTPEYSFVGLTHVYRPDVYNTVQLSYGLWPMRRTTVYGFTRYGFEESVLEEQGLLVAYKTDCVGYGIGGSFLSGDFISQASGNDEDEWKVYFQVWLLAFPGSSIDLGI